MSTSRVVVESPVAIDPGLVMRRADPLNCETPITALVGGTAMPNARFYVRNHFAAPALDGSKWRLKVGGLVKRPLRLGLRDLFNLPSQVMTVTLECAGNGRASLSPAVGGEQWELGAVSTAEWTGVALTEVLDRAGVRSEGREVVFKGADGPTEPQSTGANRFERSLSLKEIRQSEVLLAYAMNGEPLPVQHGYPLRVIVPGWYGVAAVKWLTDIEVIGHAFDGYFQTQKYVFEWDRNGRLETEAVRQQRVRALITEPHSDEEVGVGRLVIRGLAWSGVAPVSRVEVTVNGDGWQPARLLGAESAYSWRRWELITAVHRPGRISLRARATDQAGRVQPEKPDWNRLGYGNNAVQDVTVRARLAN